MPERHTLAVYPRLPTLAGQSKSCVDPGTLVVLQAAIGSATPPFGCDIFRAVAVFKRPYVEVIRGTPPFVCMLLLVSVLLIFFPGVALFLRDVAFAR